MLSAARLMLDGQWKVCKYKLHRHEYWEEQPVKPLAVADFLLLCQARAPIIVEYVCLLY